MEIINRSIFKGIAGKMGVKPKGVFIHNDAGSIGATARFYDGYLPRHNPNAGFAHYYGDRHTILRAEDTYNRAWHCGDTEGNNYYLSYEVCQSIGADDYSFLKNEDAVLMQVAEDMLYYGIPVNTSTVKLHQEVYATACPHRSVALHGGKDKTKTYFVEKIKHYQTLGKTVQEMIEADKDKKPRLKEEAKVHAEKQDKKPSVFGLEEGIHELGSWNVADKYTGLPYVTAGHLIVQRTDNGSTLIWSTINGRIFVCTTIYGQTAGWIEISKK